MNVIRHPRGHDVVVGACRKDAADAGDLRYARYQELNPVGLSSFVDLRPFLSPVEDRGATGASTANAAAAACEYLHKRIEGAETPLSRLFVYFNARKIEGTVGEDAGASIRSALKAVHKLGVCAEATWPFVQGALKDAPPEAAYQEAAAHKIDAYERVPVDLHAMKSCLSEGYPMVLGVHLFTAFEQQAAHGRIPVPKAGEQDLGAHAMLAAGYSDDDAVFLVRNSWGSDWGEEGYCFFPYEYLSDPKYVDDCWTVRKKHDLDFSVKGARQSFFISVLDNDTIDDSDDDDTDDGGGGEPISEEFGEATNPEGHIRPVEES